MITIIKNLYELKSKPVLNILVRTSKWLNYFHACYQSIINQTCNKVNLFMPYDDEETPDYLNKLSNIKKIKVGKTDFMSTLNQLSHAGKGYQSFL